MYNVMLVYFVIGCEFLESEERILVVLLCRECNAHHRGVILRPVIEAKQSTAFQFGLHGAYSPFAAVIVIRYVMT